MSCLDRPGCLPQCPCFPGCISVIRCLSPGVLLKGGHEKSTPIRAVSLKAEIILQASQSRCRAILGQQSLCAEEGALHLLWNQAAAWRAPIMGSHFQLIISVLRQNREVPGRVCMGPPARAPFQLEDDRAQHSSLKNNSPYL